MKKILLTLLGLCASSNVFAESPQMQYIKGMYKESVKLESRETNNNPYYYLKYFDSNIKKIYARADKYNTITQGTTGCLDYMVLWQGQDLNPKAKLTFTEPSKGRVKVTIGATEGLERRSVTYQVKCNQQGNSCKITEIIERGKPFTKVTSKCLDDFYRTEIKKHKD